jgi:hypothetical protein
MNECELQARNAPEPPLYVRVPIMVVISPFLLALGMVALVAGLWPRKQR